MQVSAVAEAWASSAVLVLTIHFLPPARFAGNMERQQTDNLLKSHASGTYLIRERPAEAERFAISIKYEVARGQGDLPPHPPRGHSGPRSPRPSRSCALWVWDWPWTVLPKAGHFRDGRVSVGLCNVAGPGRG